MDVLPKTLKSTYETLESCARVPNVTPQHVCECVGLSLICSLASEDIK